jgi:hypothetical protein
MKLICVFLTSVACPSARCFPLESRGFSAIQMVGNGTSGFERQECRGPAMPSSRSIPLKTTASRSCGKPWNLPLDQSQESSVASPRNQIKLRYQIARNSRPRAAFLRLGSAAARLDSAMIAVHAVAIRAFDRFNSEL